MIILRIRGQTYAPAGGVYRVRDDNHSPYTGNAPRQHRTLSCPPMMIPAYANMSTKSGTHRTPMDKYGWDRYIDALNPGRFQQAVSSALAMFNNSGWPQMESLLFGCNLVRAAPTSKPGWARILTLRYEDGPPDHLPTYAEDPLAVQAFTCICREGAIIGRDPMLYYPVVSRYPIYMPWGWLEALSADMQTPAPPRR